jgi:alanyl-tRNA synthetase
VNSTRRLYYDASCLAEFEATIIEQLTLENKPAVVLDATCFYPTSGGQPHDTGTLNGVPVLDVLEVGERIAHILAQPLPLGTVHGVLDWPRRLDHMQQHSGQHILSQAFECELSASTLSFHMSAASSTIDISCPSLDWNAAARVEELANRIVLEDGPVTVREYDADEVQTLPLRKIPVTQGRIRVVNMAEFDVCACGGTHVHRTGEVGSIHIRRWEKSRGQTRVEFLCGSRALRDYRVQNILCQTLAAQFSTTIAEMPESVARLAEAEQTARHQVEALRKRLLECELPRWVDEAWTLGAMRVICRVLEGYDASNMRYIAQTLVQKPGMVALLAVNDPSPQLCFARAEDVATDMNQLLRAVVTPLGGRGGGKPPMAQGGGVAAEQLVAILEDARQRLSV